MRYVAAYNWFPFGAPPVAFVFSYDPDYAPVGDGRRRPPKYADGPCKACKTGWMVYQIRLDAFVCAECGYKEHCW